MRKIIKFATLAIAAFWAMGILGSVAGQSLPKANRIVVAGGTITEILFALGQGDRVAAVDTTSAFPPEARAKPQIGYMRALSAEGILSQKPDLILVEQGAGPTDALAIIEASSIPVVTIDAPPEADAIPAKIESVGRAVGVEAAAADLAAKVRQDIGALKAEIAAVREKPKRVLFALSLANGRITAGGAGTAADAIIRLAGGVNAAAAVNGYKPLSDEDVLAASPDVLLVMNNGGHAIAEDAAFALPALKGTPAAAAGAYVTMDGLYLLGFGPRTAAAGRDLARALYPDEIKP
ncbi:heme/hemin ABC transporter substrate-binding protein [Pleomorphomonas carboxyditropha]|uniref:Hemin ABC transporter substrate-binding protein n=1 Tax=Pleomorphomonas carboxyditropha TaxID=2023338 RepID=A0A2G9WZL2_9HYPH|nr:ABC transporter substrate-binding protein [Pleomorphomonas carboxyditropha]PIP00152.1 hemin ABC transporter substrate-binding protein [Pleomorphomonas carboxyditropha]